MTTKQHVRHCCTAVLPLEGVGKSCAISECKERATHSIEIVMITEMIKLAVPMCNTHAILMVS